MVNFAGSYALLVRFVGTIYPSLHAHNVWRRVK